MQSFKAELAIPFDAPIKARNRKTYASFGDDGLTATANAHGHLIQITRYFGNEPSGFICVDLPGTPDPFHVTNRMKELQSSVEGMEVLFPKEFPPLIISADLLLRHLDFVTEEKPVNIWNSHYHEQNKAGDLYEHGTSANADTVFIKHKGCKTGQGEKDAILSISPYIDDSLQSVGRIGQNANYEIKIPEQAKKDLLKNSRVKITLAYTLELVSSADAVSSPLSKLDLEQLRGLEYRPPVFADDKHLNFMLRRNLEHMLSVCSIPININDESRDKIMPIALTCGDISGHRIARKASFYAFQFLLKAFGHFDNSDLKNPGGQRLADHPLGLEHATCENYSCRMRFRIWKTCRGHLTWISNHMNTEYTISNATEDGTTKEIKEQGVGPHYWASGQVIDEWNKYPDAFPDREITDAPMQLIKFGEFYRITGDEDIFREAPAGLENIAKHWVRSLHERNKGAAYAFPRIREEETGKFYLADHALIWWASKSLEELGLGSNLEFQPDNSADASEQRTIRYSSDEIKTNLIKRFTMENPASKTRMIATSRSSAETRFSLLVPEGSISINKHKESSNGDDNINNTNETSNETNETLNETIETSNEINEALDDIWGNVIDEWTNTVNYQAQREDQHDAHWNHPLQFGLATIMSAKNKCTNSRLAARMFDISRKILFEISSPNGLFPGQLDVYKRPAIFNRRIMCDSYWQATFEVPFILWKYPMPPPPVKGSSISVSESTFSDIRGLENIIKLLPSMNSNGIPNNVIDQGKVVTLSDEWLYNELECFKNNIDFSESNIEKLSTDYATNTHMTDMTVIRRATQKIQETIARNTAPQDTTLPDTQENVLGYIIDIPQRSDKKQDTPKPAEINSIGSLNEIFIRKRTTKNAKKRLLHFGRATDATALICYISAFGHPDISAFFYRHKAYTKFFHEETNAVLNLWVTELHLSFYRIVSQKISPDITRIPGFEYYNFPRSKNEKVGNRNQMSRAVMSFRFDGDFFDRHWTCLFFEFNPHQIDEKIFDIRQERITGSLKADPWKQRRVLELVLFGKILKEMVTCSEVLLDEIKTRVLESFKKGPKEPRLSSTFLDSIDLFDDITSNIFISNNKSWNIFQYILQVVEEDLGDNLTKIELWMKRKERPDRNKPRWTLNDERNY
ncbi:hypothetical protein N5P37_005866 [Trichoderma harzianum]|nr:hypothetical protein N5P37_005866 [Trichoderma harzianum]